MSSLALASPRPTTPSHADEGPHTPAGAQPKSSLRRSLTRGSATFCRARISCPSVRYLFSHERIIMLTREDQRSSCSDKTAKVIHTPSSKTRDHSTACKEDKHVAQSWLREKPFSANFRRGRRKMPEVLRTLAAFAFGPVAYAERENITNLISKTTLTMNMQTQSTHSTNNAQYKTFLCPRCLSFKLSNVSHAL